MIPGLLICSVLVVGSFAETHSLRKKNSHNVSKILSNILNGYDRRLRPFLNQGKPVTITLGMWIISIDSIDVINMDYRIDLFFRQAWKDPRLKHSHPEDLTLENSMLSKLWVPDTYFANSKSSGFHFVTVPNKMLRISQDGSVNYNCRISLRASCPMDLRNFPVDIQVCHLHIESYGYDVLNNNYEWEEDPQDRVTIAQQFRSLPQYRIVNLQTSRHLSEYVVGNWSSLQIHFDLVRKSGYAFLHLYAPCVLIVMLSWIGFFIPVDSVAARIALGITSVLTITTILNIQNNSMPKVSYIKLADWYLIVCFLFVFGTLLEFTVILFLNGREKRKELKRNEEKKDAVERESISRSNHRGSHSIAPPCNPKEHKREKQRSIPKLSRQYSVSLATHSFTVMGRHVAFKVFHIDSYARIVFPTSFLLFNIIYWYIFLTRKNQSQQVH